MMVLRKFFGLLLLLLGLAGVIACGVGLYRTGHVKEQFRDFVGQVSNSTEDVFTGIRNRLDQIDASLSSIRAELKTVLSSADAPEDGAKGGETRKDHIAFTLDHKVSEKLANAQQLVDSAEDTAEAANRLLTLLGVENFNGGKDPGPDDSLMKRIKGASGTLSRLPGMLEQARETARDLHQQPNSKEALLTLARQVGRMDKGLAEVQALATEFREGIQRAQSRFRHYHEQTVRWIHLGSILIPLLLLWLGAGQSALMLLGGRLLMKKGNEA